MRHVSYVLVLAAILASSAAHGAGKGDLVWVTGRVFDSTGRTPLAGATIAVYNSKNEVVDYAKTDAEGEYALAIPKSALHLPRGSRGFLHQVTSTVAKAAGGVGRLANLGLKAGVRAAGAVAGATDPLTRAGIGAATGLASSIIDSVTPAGKRTSSLARNQPGVLVVRVNAPGHNDAISLARLYWMQEEVFRVEGREQRATIAWLDPAHLVGEGERKPARVASDYLVFTETRISPGIAEIGQEVRVAVTFPSPPEPRTPVIVVARNARTGAMYELEPIGDDKYQCRFTVDRRFPLHDQVISVLAYAEQDARPGRSTAAERAILRARLWDPDRPFVYNPLLVASRNRAEVALTVVAPPRRK